MQADSRHIFDAMQGLSVAQQREVVSAAVKDLPEPDRAQVAAEVRATLGPPSPHVNDRLWYLVLGILGVVIVGGGWLAAVLDGSDEAALYGFVGLALGAVVGLLAPGPASSSTAKP